MKTQPARPSRRPSTRASITEPLVQLNEEGRAVAQAAERKVYDQPSERNYSPRKLLPKRTTLPQAHQRQTTTTRKSSVRKSAEKRNPKSKAPQSASYPAKATQNFQKQPGRQIRTVHQSNQKTPRKKQVQEASYVKNTRKGGTGKATIQACNPTLAFVMILIFADISNWWLGLWGRAWHVWSVVWHWASKVGREIEYSERFGKDRFEQFFWTIQHDDKHEKKRSGHQNQG